MAKNEALQRFIEALEKNPHDNITFDRELLIYMLKLMNKE